MNFMILIYFNFVNKFKFLKFIKIGIDILMVEQYRFQFIIIMNTKTSLHYNKNDH